jgi:metal-responsive CopG/Arc/MetJ family transcriptional regulator
MEKLSEKKRLRWDVETTEHLNERLGQFVALRGFRTKSEAVRHLVRRGIEAELREVSPQKMPDTGSSKTEELGGETHAH